MANRILIKIMASEKFLSFRTIMKDKKSPHSFMISKGVIEDLYDLPSSVLCSYDCGSFAQLWQDPLQETVHIRFCWLHSDGFRLVGWEQTIVMPFHTLMAYKNHREGNWALLSLDQPQFTKLVFCATDNLHAAVGNPVVRRKLRRFLRDNFKWRGSEEIRFYNDLVPYSFFFQEIQNGRINICGAVILHGQDNLEKAQYTLHT